ncbi:hypothetical protein SPRG_11275 [Saprolegnia parasitica CBS 223.65]|uniref:Uncharacterized protein n=1 Tax=Saprolegnia parasitica (strain CBS 223.65) TaxID=695850 RepID=A0A067BZZ5_SAPPC|nr:hypothetical protein SPRG_11275 [Saprolegnia parasitica CBS 223.65]KDO23843.1 hypothetical protein SPRG_11275 [Saprolegnia parasitica CBS 223.65]|eukprot:XP_012205476.1 hypothetical protein SPRG_11275 [Saprolegnia parasitica CBS 223.65]
MQRRYSGANAAELHASEPASGRSRRNSASVAPPASKARASWTSRAIRAAISMLLTFFLLMEVSYHRGCAVSDAYSRATSQIGEVTLSVLADSGTTHWLAFGSLAEALLAAKAPAVSLEPSVLAAAEAAKEMGRPSGIDYHVSSIEVAIDMVQLESTDFWNIVQGLEAKGMHVMYDPHRRLMEIYARIDNPAQSWSEKAFPGSEPNTYGPGLPHANLWFLELENDEYSTPEHLPERTFAASDIMPLREATFLGRPVAVPHRSQRVAMQEHAVTLAEGTTTKTRAQCLDEWMVGITFYEASLDRITWWVVSVIVFVPVYIGVKAGVSWVHASKMYLEQEHKV